MVILSTIVSIDLMLHRDFYICESFCCWEGARKGEGQIGGLCPKFFGCTQGQIDAARPICLQCLRMTFIFRCWTPLLRTWSLLQPSALWSTLVSLLCEPFLRPPSRRASHWLRATTYYWKHIRENVSTKSYTEMIRWQSHSKLETGNSVDLVTSTSIST